MFAVRLLVVAVMLLRFVKEFGKRGDIDVLPANFFRNRGQVGSGGDDVQFSLRWHRTHQHHRQSQD